jgi:hypothetical protein
MYAKIYQGEYISKLNTGRLHGPEMRAKMSDITKGKVVVLRPDGHRVRVSVDDHRYLSGEYVFYRTGSKHTDETKERMSDNGIKDRRLYNDGVSTIYLYSDDDIPTGFIKGALPEYKNTASKRFSGKTYYYNASLNKHIRVSEGDPVPEGYIHGRHFDVNPTIYAAKLKQVTDLIERRNARVLPEDLKPHHAPPCGTGAAKASVYLYDNLMFASKSLVFRKYGKLPSDIKKIPLLEFDYLHHVELGYNVYHG